MAEANRNRRDDYQEMINDDMKIVEVWKMNGSPIAQFVSMIEEKFGLIINYKSGDIIRFREDDKPHLQLVKMRFVLNNQILETEKIYYDDKQLFLRLTRDQSIRRVSLKIIKEIHYDGQFMKRPNGF